MFKDEYRKIYDQVTPDNKLISDTLTLKPVSKTSPLKRISRFTALPVGAVASLFITFTLLVNLSPAFVLALEPIPVLREIAGILNFSPELIKTVEYSPSLNAAVDNDYIQIIGLEQTVNGITMQIECVIVDEQQLHIFYKLLSEEYTDTFLRDRTLHDTKGRPLDGYTSYTSRSLKGYWDGDIQQEDLRHIIFVFSDSEVPGELIFECGVTDLYKSEYEPLGQDSAFFSLASPIPVSVFSFPLSFDKSLIPETEAIPVNQEISLDGQEITVIEINVSPTHTRVDIDMPETNTAWLKALSLYLIDENGVRYNQTGYCIDNPAYNFADNTYNTSKNTYYLESTYFAESSELTLVITDAVWLDKDAGLTKIDLVHNTAENLPPNVELIYIGRVDNDYCMTFSAPNRESKFSDPFFKEMGRQIYTIFENVFIDEDGNVCEAAPHGGSTAERYEIFDSVDAWATHLSPEEYVQLVETEAFLAENIPEYRQGLPNYYHVEETPGRFGYWYIIIDYPYDTLYLKPFYSAISTLDAPIEIVVR